MARQTQNRPFAVGFRLPNFCRSFSLTAEGGAEQRPYAVPRHLFDEGSKFIEREPLPKAVADPGEGDVENEVAIRDLVSKLLGDARYRVLTASNGPTGVALLQSDERIDLLVTKMGLPGRLNGRQVADLVVWPSPN